MYINYYFNRQDLDSHNNLVYLFSLFSSLYYDPHSLFAYSPLPRPWLMPTAVPCSW